MAELTIDDGLFRYNTFEDLIAGKNSTEIIHPAVDTSQDVSLYATESRVILHSESALPHLFELTTDQHGQTSVQLIDDLEGLGVVSVVPGSANRFGVITDSGDAYLIPKGSVEVEPVEVDDDSGVKLLRVGSKFEVVVTGDNVLVRGNSKLRSTSADPTARK